MIADTVNQAPDSWTLSSVNNNVSIDLQSLNIDEDIKVVSIINTTDITWINIAPTWATFSNQLTFEATDSWNSTWDKEITVTVEDRAWHQKDIKIYLQVHEPL